MLLLAGACAAPQRPGPAAPADLVLRGLVVVDPVSGSHRAGQDVFVAGDRIVAVRDTTPVPPAARRVIEGGGRYLVPGLWDMHAHWYDETSLPLFTLNGVTGVRMMRGEPVHYAWRGRGIEGTPAAPRMYLASPLVDGRPATSQPAFEVDTPARAREVVQWVERSGADFLKVYDKIPRDAYLALLDEAAARSVRVEGHVPVGISWQEAAQRGVQRSFEHLHSLPVWASADSAALDRRWQAYYRGVDYNQGLGRDERLENADIHARAYDSFDPGRFDELAGVLASQRIWQVPTCVLWQVRDVKTAQEYELDPRMRRVPGWMRGWWSGWMSRDPEVQAVEARVNCRRTAFCLDRYRDFQRSGVPLLAGTDVMMPYVFAGTSLHEELALMVQAGLSPAQALATATSGPAQFMGRPDLGAIREGALADMVLLDADPLADISAVSRIHGVVVGGSWVGPDERERELARIELVLAAPAAADAMARTLATSGLEAALASHAGLCPADPAVRDCNGFNIAFALSMALAEHKEKARTGDLVDWVVARLVDDPDALFWAAGQYGQLDRHDDAAAALDRLLEVAPGYALAMEMRASKPPATGGDPASAADGN